MFEQFSHFNQILVTGPQRSGTTICARMISKDTGHQFMPEGVMATDNKHDEALPALQRLLARYTNIVVQCPIQCRFIEQVSAEDRLIVIMRRDIGDIQASEQRIGWGGYWQRVLYDDVIREYGMRDAPIAEVKYAWWERHQKHRIKHWHEQDYEALADHELWVPKAERMWRHPRQTGNNISTIQLTEVEVLV